MNIVIFSHPVFLNSQSMPRYANWLAKGMKARGHSVKVLTAQPLFYKLRAPGSIRKWLGYIDQFLVFPASAKKQIRNADRETIFVYSDHALGPWVPLTQGRPHVIHCHDFLAQQSALKLIDYNPTSWTGTKYQGMIRRGFQSGKNFISISKKTQSDLHALLTEKPGVSQIVYNGLLKDFKPGNVEQNRTELSGATGLNLSAGYILHVGGNQWYKNRKGVIEIYDAWRASSGTSLPLLMVGAKPTTALLESYQQATHKNDIHFLTGKDDDFIMKAYQGATAFLFPSIAEGFGWPIAEAMASGSPVITTAEAPMNEVGGNAAFYIPKYPEHPGELQAWLAEAATMLSRVVNLASEERQEVIDNGLRHVKRFDSDNALDQIEKIYQNILRDENPSRN